MSIVVRAGQIWRDDCYYFDINTEQYKRKFVLALSVIDGGDILTAVFTSQPNGLTSDPVCSTGIPRAGFYIGNIPTLFHKETWVDFSSIQMLDIKDLKIHLEIGRKIDVRQPLGNELLCGVLRCVTKSEDITQRQMKYIYNTISNLGCA